MARTRQILQRRGAVENVGKVTHTMETVSAVRYRQFYKNWAEGGMFYDFLAQLAYLIVTAEKTIEHPLMLANDSNCHALIVIGSDRGLCGGYNSNVFKLIDVHLNMAKRFDRELKVYVKGKKAVNYLAGKGVEITKEYNDFEGVPTSVQAKEIADDLIGQYIRGEIGRVGIVYTRFYSPASQHAQTLTILPVAELIDDLTTRATVIWPWELAFEDFLLSPSAEEIFDSLATMMVRTAISGCFVDAAASEHLTRVVAMRNATDNAEEMLKLLTQEYNRARQNEITTELLDIIGGTVK